MVGGYQVTRLQYCLGARVAAEMAQHPQEPFSDVVALAVGHCSSPLIGFVSYRARANTADDDAIEDQVAAPSPGRPTFRFQCPMPSSEIETRSSSTKYCNVCRKTLQVVSSTDILAKRVPPGRCIAYQK
mmetsp:Transcript_39615/g.93027  ORF Transcript_39615/g.93027 Transcript_39615/m.93027 type:complete len:129 (-) Transcript_39615:848-1234(-)